MSDIGSNSVDDTKLRAFFDRIVTMETQRRERAEDVREIYREAKSEGFDVPALREVVKAHFINEDEEKAKKAVDKHEMAHVYATPLQVELPF